MHVLEGEQFVMRIYVREGDKHNGRAVYHEIIDLLHDEKAAGVTVLRGIAGFGEGSSVRSSSLLSLSKDLPIVIEIVDSEEKISLLRPKIEETFVNGLITLQKVHAARYVER